MHKLITLGGFDLTRKSQKKCALVGKTTCFCLQSTSRLSAKASQTNKFCGCFRSLGGGPTHFATCTLMPDFSMSGSSTETNQHSANSNLGYMRIARLLCSVPDPVKVEISIRESQSSPNFHANRAPGSRYGTPNNHHQIAKMFETVPDVSNYLCLN